MTKLRITSKIFLVILTVSVVVGAAAFTFFQHFFPLVTDQPAAAHAGLTWSDS